MGIEKCLVTTVFSLLQLSLLMDSTVLGTLSLIFQICLLLALMAFFYFLNGVYMYRALQSLAGRVITACEVMFIL